MVQFLLGLFTTCVRPWRVIMQRVNCATGKKVVAKSGWRRIGRKIGRRRLGGEDRTRRRTRRRTQRRTRRRTWRRTRRKMRRRTQRINFLPWAKNPAKNEMKNLWRFWQGKTWLKSPPPISTSIFTCTTGLRSIQSSPAPRAPHASNLHQHRASNLHRRHGPPKYPILTSTTGLRTRKFSLNNLLSRVRPSSHGVRALGQELNLDRRSHFRLARHVLRAVVRAWDRRNVARSPAVRFPMATVFRDFGSLPDNYFEPRRRVSSVCHLGNLAIRGNSSAKI